MANHALEIFHLKERLAFWRLFAIVGWVAFAGVAVVLSFVVTTWTVAS